MGDAVSLGDPELAQQCPPGPELDRIGLMPRGSGQFSNPAQVAGDDFARLLADDRVKPVRQMPDFDC